MKNKIFQANAFYRDSESGILLFCIETSKEDSDTFNGLFISQTNGRIWYNKMPNTPKARFEKAGSISSHIVLGALDYIVDKNKIEATFPDEYLGYHTSIKNTHPTDNDTKLQIPGPQGQVAETKRRDIWARAAIAVAGSSNCSNIDTPMKWADRILAAFDEKFNNQ